MEADDQQPRLSNEPLPGTTVSQSIHHCGSGTTESDKLAGHWYEAMINTTSLAAARSGFLAGFSYYEFSRISTARAERVPWYPRLLYIAFTLSIVSSAIATTIQIFSRKVHRSERMGLCERLNPHTAIGGPARGGYVCFILAFACYTVAVSLMHTVTTDGHFDSTRLGRVSGVVSCGSHYVTLSLQVLIQIYFLGKTGRALNKFRESSDQDFQTMKTSLHNVEKSSDWIIKADVVVQDADNLGSRALFLVGVLGHALARHQPRGHSGMDEALNILYTVFINLSAATLILVVFLSTLIAMYVKDIPPGVMRELYARDTHWVLVLCRWAFMGGMHCLFIGAGIMGWGCSEPCGQLKVPHGACYADVAYVPAVLCSFALLVVWFSRATVMLASRQVRAARQRGASEVEDIYGETASSDLKTLLNVANSATISGGFVLYNIATFDTDVIQSPLLSPTYFGLTTWAHLFLWMNWIAIAMAMAVVTSISEVEWQLNKLPPSDRSSFVRHLRHHLDYLLVLFELSLIAFMLVFACFGLCKMEVKRAEAAVVVVLSLPIIFLMQSEVWKAYKAASGAPMHDDTTLQVWWIDSCGSPIKAERAHETVVSQMQGYAQHVLLFGGFAYNAVSFLFRPTALLAPAYVGLMSLCLCTALGVTLMHTFLGAALTHLVHESRDVFVRELQGPILWSFRASVAAIICFISAFSIMGYIKQWSYVKPAETDQLRLSDIMGWLQLATACAALTLMGVLVAKTKALGRLAKECDQIVFYDWKSQVDNVRIQAAATTFQVGNVFYEILFGGVNENNMVATWFYFGLAMVTFGLGVMSVVVASYLCYEIYTLPTADHRSMFAFRTHDYQVFLTVVYGCSLAFWLLHFCFSGPVKLECMKSTTPIIGGLGMVILIASCFRIVYITSGFRKESTLNLRDLGQIGGKPLASKGENRLISDPNAREEEEMIPLTSAIKALRELSTSRQGAKEQACYEQSGQQVIAAMAASLSTRASASASTRVSASAGARENLPRLIGAEESPLEAREDFATRPPRAEVFL